MIKNIAIVGYNADKINVYREQINKLFINHIDINTYYIDEDDIQVLYEDIVLLTSYKEFEEIRNKIASRSQVIFINRTVTRAGIDKLKEIPKDSKVVLYDDEINLAKQMIKTLYQIGIKHINISPAISGEEVIGTDYYIVMGDSDRIIKEEKIIDIGSNILDISTIMDIAITLDLEDVLTRRNIKKVYREIVTADYGLSGILGKTNKFESQVDIMLQVVDDGVLAINSDGMIFSYNEIAKKILGITENGRQKIDGISLYAQIPFEYVLNKRKAVKERLIKIRDYDVVISVDPIIHSGKLYGAVAIIRRFSDSERKQHKLRAQLIGKGHKAKYTFDDIIGESEGIIRSKEIAKRMSKSNSSILISGESGTGKELFAQAIHNSSSRESYQFVAVNCGALPESLLESELFGYEEGAFTGARKGGKPGLFELAHKGTLFLDEVGEMPIKLQMRLLRVLQEREVMRIGGDRLINVDLRIIAATNRDLKQMVNEGQFREDLYYRLNVLPLKTPPLRTRTGDIIPLIDQMKKGFNSDFKIAEDARQILLEHNWKGNVRELRNYVEYFVNLGNGIIGIEDLPMELGEINNSIILDREEKELMNRFFEMVGKNETKYVFILNELNKAYKQNKRMGRRSLYQRAKEHGVFISEQEARTILLNLEKHLLVEIYKGRSGTVITNFGRKILNYIQKG